MKVSMDTITIIQADLENTAHVSDLREIWSILKLEGETRYETARSANNATDFNIELFKNPAVGCVIFLAMTTEQTIGIAICQTCMSSWDLAPVLNIHDFFVMEKFRGQGIGTLVIRFIERYASKNGMSKVTLETNVGNIDARRLYKNLGYSGAAVDANDNCLLDNKQSNSSIVIQLRKKI